MKKLLLVIAILLLGFVLIWCSSVNAIFGLGIVIGLIIYTIRIFIKNRHK